MKNIDEIILNATPEELAKIQELDLDTQLDGKSFYDNCLESKIAPNIQSKKKHSD